MARLILSLDGQTLAEYNMTKERYTVGRLLCLIVDVAELVVADRDHVAVLQRVLLDQLAVDVGAVRAVQVLEKRVVEDVDDQRVVTADGRVVDADVVVR